MVWERSCALTSALLRRTDRFFSKREGERKSHYLFLKRKELGK